MKIKNVKKLLKSVAAMLGVFFLFLAGLEYYSFYKVTGGELLHEHVYNSFFPKCPECSRRTVVKNTFVTNDPIASWPGRDSSSWTETDELMMLRHLEGNVLSAKSRDPLYVSWVSWDSQSRVRGWEWAEHLKREDIDKIVEEFDWSGVSWEHVSCKNRCFSHVYTIAS